MEHPGVASVEESPAGNLTVTLNQGWELQPKEEFSAPSEWILQLPEMPLEDPWNRFQSFVSALPGDSKLTVSTPEGDFELGEFDFSEEDRKEIEKILVGSKLLAASGV